MMPVLSSSATPVHRSHFKVFSSLRAVFDLTESVCVSFFSPVYPITTRYPVIVGWWKVQRYGNTPAQLAVNVIVAFCPCPNTTVSSLRCVPRTAHFPPFTGPDKLLAFS